MITRESLLVRPLTSEKKVHYMRIYGRTFENQKL